MPIREINLAPAWGSPGVQAFTGCTTTETYTLRTAAGLYWGGRKLYIRAPRYDAYSLSPVLISNDSRPDGGELTVGQLLRFNFPDGHVRDYQICAPDRFNDVKIRCAPDSVMVAANRIVTTWREELTAAAGK